jgi:hypothetical protein
MSPEFLYGDAPSGGISPASIFLVHLDTPSLLGGLFIVTGVPAFTVQYRRLLEQTWTISVRFGWHEAREAGPGRREDA